MHAVVGELMHARNLYIALYDEERQLINYPYRVDELDDDWPEVTEWVEFGSRQARGVAGYVLRTGEPQLITYERQVELAEQGEIEIIGALTQDSSWLGVPLEAEGRTVGLLAVQSYTKDVSYGEQDEELLAFVGQHVGPALSRARAIEETRQRNAELALINSPDGSSGHTGTLHRATYTCVGDTVNVAARLESHTKVLNRPILIDENTRHGLDDGIAVEAQGELQVKGKAQPVKLYAVGVDSLVAEAPAAARSSHSS